MIDPYQIGTLIGTWIGVVAIVAFVIWIVWALWKYRPFSHFIHFWHSVRYFFLQVILMYSNKPSIFSIKRFHNGLITYWAIITASLYIRHQPTLSPEGLVVIMLPLLAIGGYNIYQSQQDKKLTAQSDLVEKVVDSATDLGKKVIDNGQK